MENEYDDKYLTRKEKVPTIEILVGEYLVDKINHTDKKISIRHYLNTYLAETGVDDKQKSQYALYVRIIFNRQTVKIKSNTNFSFSRTQFMDRTDEVSDILKREALAYTFIINKEFKNGSKFIKQHHPDNFKDNNNHSFEFDVTKLFETFDYSRYQLPYLINQELLNLIKGELSKPSDYSFLFDNGTINNAYHLLSFLKNENEEFPILEGKINTMIWFFNFHYNKFIKSNQSYSRLGATMVDLKYLNFGKDFCDFYGNDIEFNNLMNDINELLKI